MQFNFPKEEKKETLNISINFSSIKKVRKLAEIKGCTINTIYTVLIQEALDEYEEKYGELEEKESKKNFSHKRDVLEPGDKLRKEIDKVDSNASYFEAVEIAQKAKESKTDKLEITAEETEEGKIHCEECSVEILLSDDDNMFEYKDSILCKDCFEKKAKSEETDKPIPTDKNSAAVESGRLGGLKGGPARAEKLSPEERSDIARKAGEKQLEAERQEDTKVKALIRYCQNPLCPKPEKKYIDNLYSIEYIVLNEVFHFCSEKCKVTYLQQDNRYGYEPVNYSNARKYDR